MSHKNTKSRKRVEGRCRNRIRLAGILIFLIAMFYGAIQQQAVQACAPNDLLCDGKVEIWV